MKFLCIPCDSPMKLQAVGPPERGSLSVVYECPACGYEMAMLTNPFETQLVQSLGVRVGPEGDAAASSRVGAPSLAEASAAVGTSDSRCPFTAMIPAMDEARPGQAEAPMPVRWTPGAEARLANIPAFVRPMARTGIERFARERGSLEVDEQVLDAAREFFGM
jgi:hypothetical protein